MGPSPPPAWSPTEEQARESRLWRFMQALGCSSYPELCQKAAEDAPWFWDALVKDLGIVWSTPYRDVMDTSPGLPFTRWFPGGLLNAYESAVVRHRRSDPDRLAIIGETEAGTSRQLTYAQLDETVERVAAGLRAIGVERGVAVGLYLPLVIENAVALLACTKLGAVAVPLFSGFGAEAIRQRLSDAQARVLITADAAIRRGRPVLMKPVALEAASGLSHLDRLVVVPCAGVDTAARDSREIAWDELEQTARPPVETEAMRPEDPLLLLYTSGTTGSPKGTVHGHAGLPIKAAQDWALGMDVRPGERVMWVTDMGWVMGPLLVYGSLMLGATVVFYDGAPDHPEPRRVWEVADRHGVTHLGISPTLTRVLMSAGNRAAPERPVSRLRVLASTGVDVKHMFAQLGVNRGEGGPFIPSPAGQNPAAISPEKLAALRTLIKALPVTAPLESYELGSPFGVRGDPINGHSAYHTGIDLRAPYMSPVYATAAGVVTYSGYRDDYGKVVEIDHGNGISSRYAHLHRQTVSVGQRVAGHSQIGFLGSTGRATGPHVHYEVLVNGEPQDPEKFLGLARVIAAVQR